MGSLLGTKQTKSENQLTALQSKNDYLKPATHFANCIQWPINLVKFLNYLLTGDEIKALLSLTKLFPGVKKLKDTGSDFIVNVAEVR